MKQAPWVLATAMMVAGASSPAWAAPTLTRDNGAAVGDNQNSLTAGPRGGTLLQDMHLIEKLARFDRERIPERVVHARGTGAYGHFVSAGDFGAFTRASMLAKAGKRTEIFVRFSTVIHPKGSPETLRDPRGFALKFYTDEGNWDIVGNNLNVFFIRDAMKFPDMVHSLKPSPVTNRQEPSRFFDFFSHQPESTHMLSQVYSDLGIPASYREMDGSSVHAFKLVNAQGRVHYGKFSWKSLQGVKGLTTPEEVARVQAQDFQHATKDLYAAIAAKRFPSWELRVQLLPAEKLDSLPFDALDATKNWPEALVKPTTLGRFTLDRIPPNFFEHVEQVAYSPSALVPGVEPSEDRLLQGRLFSYPDTQRHRLGANFLQLAVNRPRIPVRNNNQDGALNMGGRDSDVNYEPSVTGQVQEDRQHAFAPLALVGVTQQASIARREDFVQAGEFFRSLDAAAQTRLIQNLAGDLSQVPNMAVRAKVVGHFRQADRAYGDRLAALVGVR